MEKILKYKKRYNLNFDIIKDVADTFPHVFTRTTLINFLYELQINHKVYSNLSLRQFKYYLLTVSQLFREVVILHNGKQKTRLINNSKDVSPYQVALSLVSKSYLSHYSALVAHDLTINNPKKIFINKEQSPKKVDPKNSTLTQKKIDYAFSKPMKLTNNRAKFMMNHITYEVYILNGKHTGNMGVISKKPFGFSEVINVTDIERTLIDTMVRPSYSGGTKEILNAFSEAKNFISINKLNAYLKKLNYIYPYEQSALTYCILANYPEKKTKFLKRTINNQKTNLTFYLDYQMASKTLNREANVFYPSELE